MQPLNAIDAVAPAFTRTHQTLFQPFQFGRSWKLAASSYLGWVGSMFLPLPLFLFILPRVTYPGFEAARALLFGFSIVLTLVSLIVLYFCGRMEMVVFEMVATRAKFIAPMWRRYSRRIWPWLGMKVLVGTVYTALIVALFYAPMKHLFVGMMSAFPPPGAFPRGSRPDPQAMQAILGPMIAQWVNLQLISISISFLLKIPSTLLNDFVLPFYVLEDIPLFAAIGRGFQVFVADPIQVILYLILKPILFVIGYMMQSIALGIAMIPVILLIVIGAVIAGVTMHHSGAGGGLLFIAAAVVFYIAFIALIIYVSIGMIGYLLTLLEAYGIYFLGGRYPLLGNILEPGPGAPFTPPPVFPSKEEEQDDDGGPPMPMDPAVA